MRNIQKRIEKKEKTRLRSNFSTSMSFFATKLDCLFEFNFLLFLDVIDKK